MSFIVIGFYTEDTPYEDEIQGLVKSCANFNIQCEVRGYPSRDSWQENTCIKPEFILDMMEEFPNKDLVYIDADGIVQQYPELFDTMTDDIAIHYKDGTELLSGTIFIKNNDKMKLFIKCWINILSNHPQMIDQKGLNTTIIRFAESQGVSVGKLPATYTQIYDLMKDAGNPVIEHFQASRRFRQSIVAKKLIPDEVMGQKVRKCGDGSFFLVRAKPNIIKYLDERYTRVHNELKWYPNSIGDTNIQDIAHYFEGKDCYIVGKGPSIDKLKASDFENPRNPIICINESIHQVEKLGLPNKVFAMQQDTWLKDTCRPKYATLLITIACRHWYADFKDQYQFTHSHLGLITNNLTVVYALTMARKFGASGYKLMCFDACVNESVEYGKCIGHNSDSGGSPERFLGHKEIILGHTGSLPIEFIIPTGLRKYTEPYRP